MCQGSSLPRPWTNNQLCFAQTPTWFANHGFPPICKPQFASSDICLILEGMQRRSCLSELVMLMNCRRLYCLLLINYPVRVPPHPRCSYPNVRVCHVAFITYYQPLRPELVLRVELLSFERRATNINKEQRTIV